jgi:hypothetical protein
LIEICLSSTLQEKVKTFIEKYPKVDEYLVLATEKTKVDKEFIFVGALAVVGLLTFFLMGGSLVM